MDTALDIANDLRSELHYLTEYVARLESRIRDLEGAADTNIEDRKENAMARGDRVRVRVDADNTDTGKAGEVLVPEDHQGDVMVLMDGECMGQFVPALHLERA
jgi:hypothetical protein